MYDEKKDIQEAEALIEQGHADLQADFDRRRAEGTMPDCSFCGTSLNDAGALGERPRIGEAPASTFWFGTPVALLVCRACKHVEMFCSLGIDFSEKAEPDSEAA